MVIMARMWQNMTLGGVDKLTTKCTRIMDKNSSSMEQLVKMFSWWRMILGVVEEVVVLVTMANVEWAP